MTCERQGLSNWQCFTFAPIFVSVVVLNCGGDINDHPGSGSAGSGGRVNVSGGALGVSGVSVSGGALGVSGVSETGGTGGTASTCFSPTEYEDLITPGASGGCECDSRVVDSVCVHGYTLICMGGYWIAGWDGPCMPWRGSGGFGNTSFGKAGEAGVGGRGGAANSSTVSKPCGARAGNTCTQNEYCAYQPGERCGAADAEAVCLTRPQSCSDENVAVCGCDGTVYPSSCAAAVAGVGVYSVGACSS